jgi:uncharacterized phage protein gp47/JayE
MPYKPKTQQRLLEDMLANVEATSRKKLKDRNPGSNVRQLLEAASVEDAEQYVQGAQLLDDFSHQTAAGPGLDGRAQDWGAVRRQPTPATGRLRLKDSRLVRSVLKFDVPAGATELVLDFEVNGGTRDFPTSFPFDFRIGETALTVEDGTVSGNDTDTNKLTVSRLRNAHKAGEIVAYVTGAADRSIPAGTVRARRPETPRRAAAEYVSTQPATHVNGNYYSTTFRATATVAGENGNAAPGEVREFASAPPYDGAEVESVTAFSGGLEIASDEELRDALADVQQGANRATELAIIAAVKGTQDPVTGQVAVFVRVIHDLADDELRVYVDDGSGGAPDIVRLSTTVMAATVNNGASALPVQDARRYPREGYLVVSPGVPISGKPARGAELVRFTDINVSVTPNQFVLATPTTRIHEVGDQVLLVDVITLTATPGQRQFHLSQAGIVRGTARVFVDDAGSGPVEGVLDEDYFLNRGRGDGQLDTGAPEGSAIIANYSYYGGLLGTCQRRLNGSGTPGDEGYGARGVFACVEAPVIRRVAIWYSLAGLPGFDEEALRELSRQAVESYIASLASARDHTIVVSEIIRRAKVPGVHEVIMRAPLVSVPLLENEIAIPFSSSGESLVRVT